MGEEPETVVVILRRMAREAHGRADRWMKSSEDHEELAREDRAEAERVRGQAFELDVSAQKLEASE